MPDIRMIAAAVTIAMMAFGSMPVAFGKAHDQGKADGTLVFPDAENAKQQIDFLTDAGILDGHGVSAVQNKGKRGEIQSDLKGDGRVVPVVNDK